jgi:hypothetical protein
LVIGSPFEDGVFLRRIEKNRLVDLTLSPPSPLSLSHGERERGGRDFRVKSRKNEFSFVEVAFPSPGGEGTKG